jgi:hypothetical protein
MSRELNIDRRKVKQVLDRDDAASTHAPVALQPRRPVTAVRCGRQGSGIIAVLDADPIDLRVAVAMAR